MSSKRKHHVLFWVRYLYLQKFENAACLHFDALA